MNLKKIEISFLHPSQKLSSRLRILTMTKKINQSSLFENNDSNPINFEYLYAKPWSKSKEILSEEFKSFRFYISDHPLSEYEDIFNQLKIISYDNFYNNDENEGLIAGTIMSIQEKKSAKGTPYAIIKFSDLKREFELFVFAELLVTNRNILKKSESFIITLQKDVKSDDNFKKRLISEKY